jgi:hypothetical protein
MTEVLKALQEVQMEPCFPGQESMVHNNYYFGVEAIETVDLSVKLNIVKFEIQVLCIFSVWLPPL